MISEQLRPDVDQAAETADYAVYLARRRLTAEFPGQTISPADCIALAAVIVTKLNMMHDSDLRYLEMESANRRATRSR